jgi:two-component system OmpR family sensor kinase
MSLRLRLLITLCPLFVAALVLADAGTYVALRSFLLSRVDGQLRDGHVGVEQALEARANLRGSAPGGRGPDDPGGPVSLPSGTHAELRGPSGEVLATYSVGPEDGGGRPVLPATLTPGPPRLFTAPGSGGAGSYRVYVETASGPAAGDLLMVAEPLDDVQSTLQQLLVLELAIAGGVTLVVVLATALLVRRGLRPLERIGSTARSIVLSDLSQRVTPATERTESVGSGLLSTACSVSSSRPSPSARPTSGGCATSSPTPPTSCAPRSPRCVDTPSCCAAIPRCPRRT